MSTTSWGNWTFDSSSFVIRHVPNDYDVNLDQCLDSSDILDCVMQVDGKTWATDEDVKDLVRAFRNILNPQAVHGMGGLQAAAAPRMVACANGYEVAFR